MGECDHCDDSKKCPCDTCLKKAGAVVKFYKQTRTVDCSYCKSVKRKTKYVEEMCPHCFGPGECSCSWCSSTLYGPSGLARMCKRCKGKGTIRKKEED